MYAYVFKLSKIKWNWKNKAIISYNSSQERPKGSHFNSSYTEM